jgi:hypothetical protein
LGGTAADIGTLKLENGQIKGYDGTDWQPVRVNDAGELILASDAQILTILGGTAADIGTLKLENGQIKGYDGTDWQPVRVNGAGELILASEVTVNAEGLSVDLGKLVLQAKNPSGVPVDMKSDTEGNLKVSLSGTMAVDVIVNAISIPPQTWGSWLDIPAGKHCMLLVACDQPWKMDTNTLRGITIQEGTDTHMYPDKRTSPQAPSFGNYPSTVVVGMFAKESADRLTAVQNVITPPNFKVRFRNESADNVATLWVRMITWGVV